MSESDWSSEHQGVAKPKKGIPGWVWGCGGGCALALLVGVILAYFGIRAAKKLVDQDANWARIGEVLPVVERPKGYFVIPLPMKIDGLSVWTLVDTEGGQRQLVLFYGPGGSGTEDTRRELFEAEGDVQLGGPLKGLGRNEVELGTLEVQGRELRVVRYQALAGDRPKEGLQGMLGNAMEGASLIADLSAPGSAELLALIYTKQRTREPVSDDELREFLAGFRLPTAPAPPAIEVPAPEPDPEGDK